MTAADALNDAIASVPAGRWLVGVSGGADSVALLRAIVGSRPGVEPIVVHLDHETRGDENAADAAFVAMLARSLDVPSVVERISSLGPIDERNDEARFRLARRRLFERVVRDRDALGVLLAHHADDRAETTLLRLLRGGEPTALDGLRRDIMLGELRVLRPLIDVRRAAIEAWLGAIGQPWRTDVTNATDRYARNRVRRFLSDRPALATSLMSLADAAARWADWTSATAPLLAESFACDDLADSPAPLARCAARRWLRDRGALTNDLSADVVERLIAMCVDRATAATQAFPGAVKVRRHRNRVERVPTPAPAWPDRAG